MTEVRAVSDVIAALVREADEALGRLNGPR
jgi:hypothetical protein